MKNKNINEYLKASVFYLFGNGIGQGIIFLSSIIFTRIMTQEDYGLYTTYYSAVSILNTLVGANLFMGLNNAYLDYKESIYRYRSSNLFLSTLVWLAVSAICLVTNVILDNRFPVLWVIMALLHAYGFFVINYYNYSANMENKYIPKTVLLMLPNILQVAISIVFILALPYAGIDSRIIGSTLGVCSCALVVYFFTLKKGKCIVNKGYWKYGLKISVPSVFSSISYMLMSQCDNMMITAFHGADETAVYGLVYNIGYILLAISQATGAVIQAWLFRMLDNDDTSSVKRVQKWYLFIFAAFAVGLLMISPEIIRIMSPESYWNFKYVAPFVAGSYLMVMYGFYATQGAFYKKNAQVSICVFTAALINVVLNYFFIPKFGGVAAAITSMVSYSALFVMLRILGQKLHKDLFSSKFFYFSFAFVAGNCITFELIYSNSLLRYLVYSALLIVMLVYFLKKRDEWLPILKAN